MRPDCDGQRRREARITQRGAAAGKAVLQQWAMSVQELGSDLVDRLVKLLVGQLGRYRRRHLLLCRAHYYLDLPVKPAQALNDRVDDRPTCHRSVVHPVLPSLVVSECALSVPGATVNRLTCGSRYR